jgi:hypothetical protein
MNAIRLFLLITLRRFELHCQGVTHRACWSLAYGLRLGRDTAHEPQWVGVAAL